MEIIKFSEKQANDYYDLWSDIRNKESISKMAEKKRYKIDKSAKSMSNDDWSNVDKTKLRNDILDAENSSELVEAVYLKVEKGWQDAPSEKLGYPVMQLKGDTFVYNRNALANAKARAVQQNETEVLNKLNSIYKKLGLNDEEKQGDNKMAKLEDNKAVECSEDDKKQENIVMNDCGGGEKKAELSEDGKTDDDKKDDDDMHDVDKKDDDKESEMATKCAELETKLSEMTAQMSEKDNQIKEYETELSELRTFKTNVEEAQKMEVVTATLAQVKDYMSEDKYSEYSESGKACKFADITAWKNEVLANVTTDVLNAKMSEKETDHIDMSFPQVEEKHGLWD